MVKKREIEGEMGEKMPWLLGRGRSALLAWKIGQGRDARLMRQKMDASCVKKEQAENQEGAKGALHG